MARQRTLAAARRVSRRGTQPTTGPFGDWTGQYLGPASASSPNAVVRLSTIRLVATRRSWRNTLAQATVGMGSADGWNFGRCGVGRADRLAPSSLDESELAMAIGIYFSPESFPVDKYDSTLKDLENAGAGAPAGRLYHVAMESPGGVHVFDIWESKEAFEAFGATLLPILSAAGVNPGEPMISEVHNVITA